MSAENERNIVLLYESKIIYEKFCRVFGTRYEIHWGKDLNSTMDILESRTIGVLVCDVHFQNQDIYPVVLALKAMHPELVTMIVTQSQDAQLVAELEAQEEIFTALVRPVSQQRLNKTLDEAFQYYLSHRKPIVDEILAKEAEEAKSEEGWPFAGMSLGEVLAARSQIDQENSHTQMLSNDIDTLDILDISPEDNALFDALEQTEIKKKDRKDIIFFEDIEYDE